MDEGDKIRRNLMMASTGIILYYWLELPPGAIAKRLLALEEGEVIEPWRIWAALLCVLVYLGYRFLHVSRRADLVLIAKKDLISKRVAVVQEFARDELSRIRMRGTLKGSIFKTLYSHREQSANPEEPHPTQIGDAFDWSGFTVAEVKMTASDLAPWQGTAAVIVLNGNSPAVSRQLFYQIPGYRRYLASFKAARSMVGREVIPEFLLPFLVGAFALVLSAVGLIGSLCS